MKRSLTEQVFAYGSNLSLRQMRERCPSAQQVGTAYLPGWRLAFTGWSAPWGGAVATIQRTRSARVMGAVWIINADDMATLDAYEGVPTAYRRLRVSARLSQKPWGAGGSKTVAWVYVARRDFVIGPSYRYVSRIREGYRAWGLDPAQLDEAVERAGGDDFQL